MRFLEIIKNIITDDKKFLILVFTLAIFLRVAFLLTVENRYYFSDSLEYEDSAVQILSGQGFGDFKRAPLYSVWMAGIFFLPARVISWLFDLWMQSWVRFCALSFSI